MSVKNFLRRQQSNLFAVCHDFGPGLPVVSQGFSFQYKGATKMLAKHLFVGCGGELYDTRNWEPIRKNYARHHGCIQSVSDLKASLRAGDYAWPGGYQIMYQAEDGCAICPACARENFRSICDSIKSDVHDGWKVECLYTLAECDESQICAHCGKEYE